MDEELFADADNLATKGLPDEAWVQCWLRLTMRFQSEVGVPFDNGEPEKWCTELSVYDVIWSFEGQFVRGAMIRAEVTSEFQAQYELLLQEYDHQSPPFAHRLAFNQLMDQRWDELKLEAQQRFHEPVFGHRIGR